MNSREILSLLSNDLKNEWKHMSFYVYHASAVTGLHREELKELLLKQAASEMNHIVAFADMLTGLRNALVPITYELTNKDQLVDIMPPNLGINGDHAFELFQNPVEILSYAINMESEVVTNYTQRIKDVENWLETEGAKVAPHAKWVEIFLEDQIADSRQDLDHFAQMIKNN